MALVTGAARGIGAAAVQALCREGYAVTAVDSCAGASGPPGVGYPMATADDLRTVAERYPDQVLGVEVDVRDPDGLRAAVDQTLSRFGRLDAAVAAAGVVAGGRPQWETPSAHLDTLIDTNVLGVWNTAAATIPAMLTGDAPHGCRFVAIASVAGERGLFNLTGYTLSKHAVIGIVRGLAADLVGTGVTAVAVAPGATDTPMLAATADLYDTGLQEMASHQAIRRLIEPEEVAAVIALCCSPTGAVLNGSVIRADGGFSA